MRSIEPFLNCPPTLDALGAGGKSSRKNRERHQLGQIDQMTFPTHWNNEDVRGLLYANQWRVCAYCSRNLPGNDRGDVEHFRPKKKVKESLVHGGYWWLAYDIANYVLSCGVCNSARKGNRFPVYSEVTRATFEDDPLANVEQALLLHPKYDDYDSLFEVDLSSRRVEVRPALGISDRASERALHHIEFFRINTDQHLIRERTDVLDEITGALTVENFELATSLAVRFNRQSLVARQLLKEVAPAYLPTAAFESEWLLEQIVREFDILTSTLVHYPDERSELELEESIWSLSTLLNTGDHARVVSICTELGVYEEVRTRSEKLVAMPFV